MLINVQLSRFF